MIGVRGFGMVRKGRRKAKLKKVIDEQLASPLRKDLHALVLEAEGAIDLKPKKRKKKTPGRGTGTRFERTVL